MRDNFTPEFRYETHLHTSEISKCGHSPGAAQAYRFKELGYTGIFITDHFLNGNTTVPQELPWEERIELFCRGYENAAEQGAEIGLDVLFAWEYHCGWMHLLTYGLDKEWLLSEPDMLSWDVLEYCDRVHTNGGFIVHAHPFRKGVELVHLAPGKVDAVEVANAAQPDDANRHALDFARSFSLPRTAGSDTHSIQSQRLCGVVSPTRLRGGKDYAEAVKSESVRIFDEKMSDKA